MTSKRFNAEKDMPLMPFDEKVCAKAREMKKCGLAWRPYVGCFVWDPDVTIQAPSPFPNRVYFILSLPRFIQIFDSIEQIAEKLIWVPTWHQAKLLCKQLGITSEIQNGKLQRESAYSPVEELIHIYGQILEALKSNMH